MRLMQLVLLLLSIFILGAGASLFAYYGLYLQEYHEIPMDFKVERGVSGFNLDNDSLHLGTYSPGSHGMRGINVTPAKDGRLVIRFIGNASPYVLPDKNDIRVYEGTVMPINFSVVVPEGVPDGLYTGTIKFFFYR